MSTKKDKSETARNKYVTFSMNEKEYELLAFYIKKYKLANRSRWIRETIVTQILKNLDKDYPTLFDENEMRR